MIIMIQMHSNTISGIFFSLDLNSLNREPIITIRPIIFIIPTTSFIGFMCNDKFHTRIIYFNFTKTTEH